MNTEKSKAVKRLKTFLAKYEEFQKEFEDANLYEDEITNYTLTDVRIFKTKVKFTETYNDFSGMTFHDESTDEEDLAEWVTKFNADLRRAKRYMAMDVDKLDAIQNGEIEDDENED